MGEREEENMKSAPNHKEKHYQLIKEESSHWLTTRVSRFFYFTFVTLTAILSLHLIFNTHNIIYANYARSFNRTNATTSTESCDVFKGRWIPEPNASLYTGSNCEEMEWSINCFLHGREDRDFLDWKWKPDQCELPRFSAATFFSILRGKKMAFIGDSLARNQVGSLVCLLSTVETPKSNYINKDAQDRTWEFPDHNVTIIVLWSPFLVATTKIAGTDNYNLYLDRVDTKWSEMLPFIDYAVFSSSHWFFRPNHMYEGGHVIGCTNCHMPDIADFGPGRAIRMAFRAAFRAVNSCEKCKRIVIFLRSCSPRHFENESWRTDTCNRTQPMEREELNKTKSNRECNKIQVEEFEAARNKGKGNVFDFLDITEMMDMRPDGHPDRHWRNGGNGQSDCLHWCSPGPIDWWNDLLLERIKRLDGTLSHNLEI